MLKGHNKLLQLVFIKIRPFTDLPSFGSMASIVSGFTGKGGSCKCWLLIDWIKGLKANLCGSSKDMHTDSAWTRADFDCEYSSTWSKILPTKLHGVKTTTSKIHITKNICKQEYINKQQIWKLRTWGWIF